MELAIAALISDLAVKYPVIISILVVVGVLRAVFKPTFAVLHAYVLATPSKNDDAVLDKVEASGAYKAVAFVLDWVTSIKLPEKK